MIGCLNQTDFVVVTVQIEELMQTPVFDSALHGRQNRSEKDNHDRERRNHYIWSQSSKSQRKTTEKKSSHQGIQLALNGFQLEDKDEKYLDGERVFTSHTFSKKA